MRPLQLQTLDNLLSQASRASSERQAEIEEASEPLLRFLLRELFTNSQKQLPDIDVSDDLARDVFGVKSLLNYEEDLRARALAQGEEEPPQEELARQANALYNSRVLSHSFMSQIFLQLLRARGRFLIDSCKFQQYDEIYKYSPYPQELFRAQEILTDPENFSRNRQSLLSELSRVFVSGPYYVILRQQGNFYRPSMVFAKETSSLVLTYQLLGLPEEEFSRATLGLTLNLSPQGEICSTDLFVNFGFPNQEEMNVDFSGVPLSFLWFFSGLLPVRLGNRAGISSLRQFLFSRREGLSFQPVSLLALEEYLSELSFPGWAVPLQPNILVDLFGQTARGGFRTEPEEIFVEYSPLEALSNFLENPNTFEISSGISVPCDLDSPEARREIQRNLPTGWPVQNQLEELQRLANFQLLIDQQDTIQGLLNPGMLE